MTPLCRIWNVIPWNKINRESEYIAESTLKKEAARSSGISVKTYQQAGSSSNASDL
jgi:hypothetical protein